jgi:hypothetical protein
VTTGPIPVVNPDAPRPATRVTNESVQLLVVQGDAALAAIDGLGHDVRRNTRMQVGTWLVAVVVVVALVLGGICLVRQLRQMICDSVSVSVVGPGDAPPATPRGIQQASRAERTFRHYHCSLPTEGNPR